MELFEHQKYAIDIARQSIREGKKRPIIAAPTSFGKTVMAAKMLKSCQDVGKAGWFFADRIQLVNQAAKTFSAFGIDYGVRQAEHELRNPAATIQIASIQTVQAMVKKHKRPLPVFDMAIVDECHTQYSIIDEIMEKFNNIPIIGITATPYSKGLGNKYNNLLVPITPRELLYKSALCPVRYYGGEHISFKNVGSAGPNDFKVKDINNQSDKEADRLAGCIVKNWLEWGENAQTIAFSPTQNLSKNLVDRMRSSGITSEHIDCFHDSNERKDLFEAHDNGEFKILSCSRLLNTGYDAPKVRVIIDCFPVKSVTTWVQRAGRLMRTSDGKKYAIYLDHAGNYDRFGPAEDIVPTSLDCDDGTHTEKELTSLEGNEPRVQECPQCHQMMSGMSCKACGYEIPKPQEVVDDGTMLKELNSKELKKANRTDTKQMKEQFYSELIFHQSKKGYRKGWAANQYREKYGVWPNRINTFQVDKVGEVTKGWLHHQRIKWAKRKKSV